jgi:hypothetical protein
MNFITPKFVNQRVEKGKYISGIFWHMPAAFCAVGNPFSA